MPTGRDVLVAALVAFGVLASTFLQDQVQGGVQLDWAGALLIVVTGGLLAFRRRFPVWVGVGTLIGCGIYYPFVGASGPMLATFVIALYFVAAAGKMIAAIVLSVVAMVAIVLGEMASTVRHVDNVAMFMLVGWLVAMIALGAVSNGRRAYAAEASQRATTEERLRIARELHDVLAHNISLINVQASAALHRKDQSEPALEAIKQASKDALRELRGTLGVLRQVDEPAPTRPPGLNQLADLVERTRATGLDVTVDGEVRQLPSEVDLVAYRIIQEALTNITRHAAAHTARIHLVYNVDTVCIQIVDDGRGGKVVAGNGIRGMTERARSVGGTLSVDSGPDGVSVAATLPLGAS
ncbi:sensor histidine kinase [Actinocrispum sp. NPDC049592]|uniref:sensor histidine kinase n=1 Tax=Actinocrispum sp. NPDC049592 TaxID=3154835 RepID=UPI00341517A8